MDFTYKILTMVQYKSLSVRIGCKKTEKKSTRVERKGKRSLLSRVRRLGFWPAVSAVGHADCVDERRPRCSIAHENLGLCGLVQCTARAAVGLGSCAGRCPCPAPVKEGGRFWSGVMRGHRRTRYCGESHEWCAPAQQTCGCSVYRKPHICATLFSQMIRKKGQRGAVLRSQQEHINEYCFDQAFGPEVGCGALS